MTDTSKLARELLGHVHWQISEQTGKFYRLYGDDLPPEAVGWLIVPVYSQPPEAQPKAVAEPVAWQWRSQQSNGQWSGWVQADESDAAHYAKQSNHEVRALCVAPQQQEKP